MCIRFQRSIRPVGQGAFYTEHFTIGDQVINVVYDCGTLSKINGVDPKATIKKEIHRTFSEGERIEYVFVSHFDEDHSNGIVELCEYCEVAHLVIPLVTELEWRLLMSDSDSSVSKFLRWIETFRQRKTRIYAVKALEEDWADNLIFHKFERDDIEEISSDHEMTLVDDRLGFQPFWRYVPFNFFFRKRHEALIEQLDSSGLDVRRITAGDPEFVVEHKEEIVKVLDAVPGSRNANSMCILSVAADGVCSYSMCFENGCCQGHFWDSSCLYTGDYEAGGKRKLQELLGHYMRFGHTGTLQVSHHGSYRNFSRGLIDKLSPQLCFVSCGFQNDYQHPNGSVVRYILHKGIPFVIVNEFAGTARYWNWDLDY